ncbi:MAG: hypothetical protein AABX30_02790 [Nanoarchaeota archaeon]
MAIAKAIDRLKIIEEFGEFEPLYLEYLTKKIQTETKRIIMKKRKRSFENTINDLEEKNTAVYVRRFRGQNVNGPINSYSQLVYVMKGIWTGVFNADRYRFSSSGLNRQRLKMAQVLREKGISYNPDYVARMGYKELMSLERLCR